MKRNEKPSLGISLPDAEAGRAEWLFRGKDSKGVDAGTLDPTKSIWGWAAEEVYCFPLWLQSADPEVIEPLIRMELEQRKVELDDGIGRVHDFRVVDEVGPKVQVEVSVVTADALAACPEEPNLSWQRYAVAARHLPFPEDSLTLFREQGGWVAAFSKGKKLAYLHSLGKEEFDGDLLSEITCVTADLRERRLIPELWTGLFVWDASEEQWRDMKQLLEDRVEARLVRGVRPAPQIESQRREDSVSFDPPTVAARRIQGAKRKQVIELASFLVGVYGLLVLAGWIYLSMRESELVQREANIERISPEVDRITAIQGSWERMRGAVDPDRYPLEVFHQCASLLPPKGVRLVHFEIDDRRLVLKGEASSTAQAIGYRNALLRAPAMARYEWESPQPEILPDNRAKFEAFGTLRQDSLWGGLTSNL
ncbi:MAG: hypothetical protein AAGJ31_10365 [Verrucomicrobiota bacterium]